MSFLSKSGTKCLHPDVRLKGVNTLVTFSIAELWKVKHIKFQWKKKNSLTNNPQNHKPEDRQNNECMISSWKFDHYSNEYNQRVWSNS